MVKLWISLFVLTTNIIFLSYSSIFWYQTWKRYSIQSAYAMFISILLLLVMAGFGLCSVAEHILRSEHGTVNIALFMSTVGFLYSSVQVLFTRGYFLKGEMK